MKFKNWLTVITTLFTFNINKNSLNANEKSIEFKNEESNLEILNFVREVTRNALIRNKLSQEEIDETINLIKIEDVEGEMNIKKSNEIDMTLGTNDWTVF